MRKIVLTLAVVLLAAPALADVKLIAEKDLGNDRKVWVKYESDEGQLIRAFGLNITATDGNIVDINDYAVGDNNGGYGIFPGAFRDAPIAVNPTTGLVDNWNVTGYSPLAPSGDPDAQGGIPGPAITIELGSLYTDAAPGDEGYLCSVTVDEDVKTLCIEGNAIRGNVVMEDASEPAVLDLTEACATWDECFPSTDPGYDDWVAHGKPLCWCYARQCHGDADGDRQGNDFFGWTYVSTDDLNVVIAAWQILEPPHAEAPNLNGIADVDGGMCADFDHDRQGNDFFGWMRVSTDDLAVLIDAWQALEPPKNDPAHPFYPDGIPGDCVPTPVEP